ncbi:MAG: 4Fe-4S dicluster domain-containing protein [Phycisphaerae bacterium]|nr:4Fe-4S dicluster domain-containing protein [Phycisphaerae bacterium]
MSHPDESIPTASSPTDLSEIAKSVPGEIPPAVPSDSSIIADAEAKGAALTAAKTTGKALESAAETPSNPVPDRRAFFTKLMRDAVGPLAAILEHRMEPVAQALQGQHPAAFDDDDVPSEPPDSYSTSPQPRAILRPPGALSAGDFEFACSRCAKCVEVCPVKAIQIDPAGMVAGGFPYIVPEISPCVVCADLSCMKNCPTGALVLVDKSAIRIGRAEVDHQQCLRSSGEDCRLCLEACPADINALVISSSSGKVLVKLDRCIGCGLCENTCPTEPRAIVVHPRPQLEDSIIA